MADEPRREGLSLPVEPLAPGEWRSRREALLGLARTAGHVSLDQLAALLAHGRARRWGIAEDAVLQPRTRPAADPDQLNPHGVLLRHAAEQAGLATRIVPDRSRGNPGFASLEITTARASYRYRGQQLFRLGRGGREEALNGPVRHALFRKHQGKEVIAAAGGCPPPGALFTRATVAAALACAADLPGEVCVKPNLGANGHRVFPGLREAEEIAEAIIATAAVYDQFVVEASCPGEAWRFFFVAPDVVGIKVAQLPSVLGDGRHTLGELIDTENGRRVARGNGAPAKLLPSGLMRGWVLRRQGLALDSVPMAGQRVLLGPCSNGSQGAESLARPEWLAPSYVDAMTAMFRAIPGLEIGAADVMIAAPERFSPKAFHVVEINMAPSLLAYHHPAEGAVQDVSGAIIRRLMTLAGGMAPADVAR